MQALLNRTALLQSIFIIHYMIISFYTQQQQQQQKTNATVSSSGKPRRGVIASGSHPHFCSPSIN